MDKDVKRRILSREDSTVWAMTSICKVHNPYAQSSWPSFMRRSMPRVDIVDATAYLPLKYSTTHFVLFAATAREQ
jgi:hypothetical protein